MRIGTVVASTLALLVEPAAPQGRRYALVIGINSYPNANPEDLPNLAYATGDALAVAQALDQNFDFEVTTLPELVATRKMIVRTLVEYRRSLGEHDELIVFFAGHGVQDTTTAADDTYWLTYETHPRWLDIEGIRLRHLMELVSEIPAGRKLVLLDHCFSGNLELRPGGVGPGLRSASTDTALASTVSRGPVPTNVEAQVDLASRGTAVLAASRNEAFEVASLKHGVMTSALLSALETDAADHPGPDGQRDRVLSVGELLRFVDTRVGALFDSIPDLQGADQRVAFDDNFPNNTIDDWILGPVATADPIAALVARYSEEEYNRLIAAVFGWRDWIDSGPRFVLTRALGDWQRAALDGTPLDPGSADIVEATLEAVRSVSEGEDEESIADTLETYANLAQGGG